MKKILALIMVAIMVMSTVMAVSAETVLPQVAEGDAYSVNATGNAINIVLAETETATELTAEQKALITIKNKDTGADVEFTPVIENGVLTLTVADGAFAVNDVETPGETAYVLTYGDTTKLVSVNEIWSTDFSDTNKDAEDYFDYIAKRDVYNKGYCAETGHEHIGEQAKMVVQDGKLFVQMINQPVFWIMDEKVRNQEDFTMTFSMGRHFNPKATLWRNGKNNGAAYDAGYWAIGFNANPIEGHTIAPNNVLYYGESKVNWFGFHHEPKTNANKLYNAYRKSDSNTITNKAENWFTTISSGTTVTFNEDGTVTDNTTTGLDKYKIVKEGKVLTITITKAADGKDYTYTYDTTADATSVYGDKTVPSTGGVVLGSAGWQQNYCSGAFVYGDMKITAFKEIAEGFITIKADDVTASTNAVSGNVKVTNFMGNDISDAKLVIAAFKGNNMVGVTVKTATIVNAGKFEDTFNFSVDEKPDYVKVFAWKGFDTLKPYCSYAQTQID